MAETSTESQSQPQADSQDFSVLSQRLHLELDFENQALRGYTEIAIIPLVQDVRNIRFNARQSHIRSVLVDGVPARFVHEDVFPRIKPFSTFEIRQYHLHRAKLEPAFGANPRKELAITIPAKVKIEEIQPFAEGLTGNLTGKSHRTPGDNQSVVDVSGVELGLTFAPVTVKIDFDCSGFRDGLQFVGFGTDDSRFPHVYSRISQYPGTACCIFPCIDDPQSRCSWEISIKHPRTLGDAFAKSRTTNKDSSADDTQFLASETGVRVPPNARQATGNEWKNFSDEEAALELTVVCSGESTDEFMDVNEPSMKTSVFSINSAVSSSQIGFAVGPFESVDLSNLREADEDEKLGTNATQVRGYCLPGRADELKNTAMPLAKAVDFFTTSFTTYPFSSLDLCFVDDGERDVGLTTNLLLCSNRLLFPPEIIEPLMPVTRSLVQGLAAQYSGICISAKEPTDKWVIQGIAAFMTDVFMKQLSGNNEYRWSQKLASERVCELDVDRPSLYNLGGIINLDESEDQFLSSKASLVLFILDRRLAKTGGSAGMTRIISRLMTNAKASDADGTLVSTSQFQRLCEKMGHVKLDAFFNQWVHGAGCPIFEVRQSFNKKKLVVNVTIEQKQAKMQAVARDLDPRSFMRDLKEEANEVWAGQVQQVFTGPMTIRIHEADGTPYEHIVEIKDVITALEIPYNTKYKRLKRSKRQKERSAGASTITTNAEAQDDVLLYCLGDVLQSKDEFDDWRLADWPEEIENAMGEESYEWVRMDADFEWICKMNIQMPSYMFVSQLQQDRDVVAQYESLRFMASQPGNGLMATFLIRTVMDRRYFHGIRTMAASLLPKTAKAELNWIGLFHLEKAFQEFFCVPNSAMTRPNDFSDRATYLIQLAIPRAISTIKDNSGHAPLRVKRFFIDRLKFNDNSDNEFSDCFYVASLLEGLSESLTPSGKFELYRNLTIDEEEEEHRIHMDAVNELERHRRIDEWIASYHNTFSLAALECTSKLTKANVIRPKLSDFLHYTRRGNADNLRIKAFECLVEQDLLGNTAILEYIVFSFSHDHSPYLRRCIFQAFGSGLGKLAFGHTRDKTGSPANDGLIIEQDSSTDRRAAEIARRTTIAGALAALKVELNGSKAFEKAVWNAVQSPVISLAEIQLLLDLCESLYEPEDRLMVRLRYPRYWKVINLGKGQLKFSRMEKIRTKIRKPTTQVGLENRSNMLSKSGPKISLSANGLQRRNSAFGIPKTPSSVSSTLKNKSQTNQTKQAFPASNQVDEASSIGSSRRLLVKLKVPGIKLAMIQNTSDTTDRQYAPWVPPSKQLRPTGNMPAHKDDSMTVEPSPDAGAPIVTFKPKSKDLQFESELANTALASATTSLKKRKSQTPQDTGQDNPNKRRRSETPHSTHKDDAQYAPYVPQPAAGASGGHAAMPDSFNHAAERPKSLKIRLSFGPNAAGGGPGHGHGDGSAKP